MDMDNCSQGHCEVTPANGARAAIIGLRLDKLEHFVDDTTAVLVVTINTVFLGLFLVAVVTLLVIYAVKSVANKQQKKAPRYDSDFKAFNYTDSGYNCPGNILLF